MKIQRSHDVRKCPLSIADNEWISLRICCAELTREMTVCLYTSRCPMYHLIMNGWVCLFVCFNVCCVALRPKSTEVCL